MKIFKKTTQIFLVIVLLMTSTTRTYSKDLNLEIDQPRIAKVIDIIDTDVIKVWYYYSDFDQPQIKIIKMIGIDTNNYQEAFDYTLTTLLGSIICIVEDPNSDLFPKVDGLDYEYAYVYKNFDKTFNEELLEVGYATVNDDFILAKQYNDLVNAQQKAVVNKVGIWNIPGIYKEPILNINLASTDLLREILIDTSDKAISNIISYRKDNPFNTIEEIKFADESLDYKWYEKNKDFLSVVTNINQANIDELRCLFPYAYKRQELAQQIIDYRLFNHFDSITEVKELYDVATYYNLFSDFITFIPYNEYIDTDLKVANLNTCATNDFTEATGLSQLTGKDIIKLREDNKYIFKTVGELTQKNNPLNHYFDFKFIDNLTAFTDINNAYAYELKTLFGLFDNLSDNTKDALALKIIDNRPYSSRTQLASIIGKYYPKIEPYIYAYTSELKESININTASTTYVVKHLSMNSIDAKVYKEYREKNTYKSVKEINFDLTNYGDKITLYTDVNTASYFELLHLHENMTSEVALEIIEFRSREPITSAEELIDIFNTYGKITVYNDIKDYLVFY